MITDLLMKIKVSPDKIETYLNDIDEENEKSKIEQDEIDAAEAEKAKKVLKR